MIGLHQRCALILDFDGTLVDIAPTPEGVHVPATLLADLHTLHETLGGALACISGRSLGDLRRYLGVTALQLIGSHGAEFGSPSVPAQSWQSVAVECRERLQPWPLARVECKPHGLALHWRLAPEAEPAIRALVQALALRFPLHRLQEGKQVLEILPQTASKGQALYRLMQTPVFRERVPVFIGDDRTDFSAMEAAQDLGGYGLAVGPLLCEAADACFDNPAHVRTWLHQQGRRLQGNSLTSAR